MLLAIALVGFGWGLASLYIYMESNFPQYKQIIYPIFLILFSMGAVSILILWFAYGMGSMSLSDIWG